MGTPLEAGLPENLLAHTGQRYAVPTLLDIGCSPDSSRPAVFRIHNAQLQSPNAEFVDKDLPNLYIIRTMDYARASQRLISISKFMM